MPMDFVVEYFKTVPIYIVRAISDRARLDLQSHHGDISVNNAIALKDRQYRQFLARFEGSIYRMEIFR